MAKDAASRPSKNRLGRGMSSFKGLSNLIANSADVADPDATAASYASEPAPANASSASDAPPRELPIDDVAPNPYQPRRHFAPEALAELAESIRQQGLIQPLVVVPAHHDDAEKPFVLVAGERRLRAARQAGLTEVPCVVRSASPQQMLEWAIIENIHRADLNPLERAHAYRDYLDRFDLSQAQAAERLGLPRSTISNHLRILDLHPDVQDHIASGALSFGHAKVLAGLLNDPDRQAQLANQAADNGLSVRQLEALIESAKSSGAGDSDDASSSKPAKPPYLIDIEEQLTRVVGTRVQVKPGRGKHAGKIVIDYYSLDDFDRLAGRLGLNVSD